MMKLQGVALYYLCFNNRNVNCVCKPITRIDYILMFVPIDVLMRNPVHLSLKPFRQHIGTTFEINAPRGDDMVHRLPETEKIEVMYQPCPAFSRTLSTSRQPLVALTPFCLIPTTNRACCRPTAYTTTKNTTSSNLGRRCSNSYRATVQIN